MTTVVHRSWALGAALALTLSLTACTGTGDDDPSSGADVSGTTTAVDPTAEAGGVTASPDPSTNPACQRLTAAELEAITGLAFSTSTPEDTTTNTVSEDCEWWLDESAGQAGVILQVMAGESGRLATTREVAQANFGDVTDVEVEGATGAFSYMGGTIVGMSVGGDYLQITYVTFQTGDVTPIVTGLAAAAISSS